MTAASSAATDELARILEVAVGAARAAGAAIKDGAGRTAVEKSKASDIDLVTEVDKHCQSVIEKAIADNFPSHKVLGEESVAAGAAASTAAIDALADSEWLWIVDPLDGTTNFVHGLPLSVVSIGIAHKGVVVVGVVYEPYRDELFTAVRGRGAFLNGTTRLHVADETELKRSLWAFGLHHTQHVCRTMVRGMGAIADISRGCRTLGSAALHLAYVAAGRLTGFWELDLSSWDISAGSLLVQEAGGVVTDTRGEAYTLRTRDVFATNGAEGIHKPALAALAAVNAHRPDPKVV